MICWEEKHGCVIGPLITCTPGQISFPSNQRGAENMEDLTREVVMTRYIVTKLNPR